MADGTRSAGNPDGNGDSLVESPDDRTVIPGLRHVAGDPAVAFAGRDLDLPNPRPRQGLRRPANLFQAQLPPHLR